LHLWLLPEFAAIEASKPDNLTQGLPKLEHLALSPDGRLALLAGLDKTAHLWDLNTKKEVRSFPGHEGEVKFVAFSPDGQRACTAWADGGVVRIWSVATAQVLKRIEAHKDVAWSAVFTSDGKKILTGGADGKAHLWDAQTGDRLRTFDHLNDKRINYVALTQ